jgi:hypothetical protein
MSIDPTLRTLFEELMEVWDDSIDTSEGSSFSTGVMTPLLTRIGGSPLDVDLEAFLVERLNTEIENIDVSPQSGLRDLLVRAAVVILEPVRREISALRVIQSLNNYEQMTREELNASLGNYFLSLEEGDLSTGVVRVYFLAPQSVSVTPLTRFSTGGGLNFYPIAIQSVSSTLMQFNTSGSLYYFDVTVQSELSGSQYNVDAGDINTVQGLSGAIRVENLVKFDDATSEETKEEAVARAQESITVRNLAVERGIGVLLSSSFSFADVFQVIGLGDPEMYRDVITGPVSISDVPGGIVGETLPSLGVGEEVHIGGKTDVYIYQSDPVADTVDFQNLEDVGIRVYAGTTGYTQSGGATAFFRDDRGHFPIRGVEEGDILKVDEEEREIVDVEPHRLQLASTLDGGLFGKTYEISRSREDFIAVPLYDLVAEQDGAAVVDGDGDPVQPVPGSLTLDPLYDSSSVLVKKAENIAENNIQMPLIQVTSIEFLDPLTLEASGITIPMRDALKAVALDDFAGNPAEGTIRVYFRDPVSAWSLDMETLFTYSPVLPIAFRPTDAPSGNAQVLSAPGNILTLLGSDYTSSIYPGYRITFDASIWTVLSVAYVSPNTEVTVREEFPSTTVLMPFVSYRGVLEDTILQDETTGLYYLNVPVIATQPGSGGLLTEGTEFEISNLFVEGWTLKTQNPVLSYSTKELPHLEFTRWVNDSTDLEDSGTAYAIRVNYEYASLLSQVQDFVESEDNRIAAEDVLVKHFQPAYFRVRMSVKGVDEDTAKDAITEYVNDLNPTDELEASDLVDELYEPNVGATKVTLPMTMVALLQDESREWTLSIDQDTLGFNRIQHFRADENNIVITEET